MKTPAEAQPLLESIGLRPIEAEIYIHLLQTGGRVTPYAVGRAIGRPTANVYKAIDRLAERGAVEIEEGDKRLCSAVAADSFLAHLERGFRSGTTRARALLAELGQKGGDERFSRIASVPLALQRVDEMIARGERVVVVDAFPATLQLVSARLEEAAGRGVDVRVLCYRPVEIEGVATTLAQDAESVLEYWESEQLNVIVDGREALVGLFDRGMTRVVQALFTDSLYLCCLLLAGLQHELFFHQVAKVAEGDDVGDRVRQLLAETPLFRRRPVLGQIELAERLRRGSA